MLRPRERQDLYARPLSAAPRRLVPTSVAVGPDGAYYVGELTGFPVVPGAANTTVSATLVRRRRCA